MEATVGQYDHSQDRTERKMVTRLFEGPQHSESGAFFQKLDPIQRKPRRLHDRNDQSQDDNEPGIAATEQYDFSLYFSNIVNRIDRNDVRVGPGQPAVGRGPGNAALQGDVDFTGCSAELLQPMVVSALSASGVGHSPILATTIDLIQRLRVQTSPECPSVSHVRSNGGSLVGWRSGCPAWCRPDSGTMIVTTLHASCRGHYSIMTNPTGQAPGGRQLQVRFSESGENSRRKLRKIVTHSTLKSQ
jgi:hypothetical protein